MVVVILLGLLSVAINIGIALTPTPQWSPAQTSNYVKTVKSISDVTGHPLASQIRQVSSLPYWAPAGDIYIVGDCTGAYLSTGENFLTHRDCRSSTIIRDVIEQGPGIVHKIEVTFNQPVQPGPTVPILTYGDATLVVEPLLHERVLFKVEDPDAPHIPWPPATSPVVAIAPHKTYTILVWTDPNLNRIVVWWEGTRGEGNYSVGNVLAQSRHCSGPADRSRARRSNSPYDCDGCHGGALERGLLPQLARRSETLTCVCHAQPRRLTDPDRTVSSRRSRKGPFPVMTERSPGRSQTPVLPSVSPLRRRGDRLLTEGVDKNQIGEPRGE